MTFITRGFRGRREVDVTDPTIHLDTRSLRLLRSLHSICSKCRVTSRPESVGRGITDVQSRGPSERTDLADRRGALPSTR
jgi:hypothetical protein